jgi:hypothetical protein
VCDEGAAASPSVYPQSLGEAQKQFASALAFLKPGLRFASVRFDMWGRLWFRHHAGFASYSPHLQAVSSNSILRTAWVAAGQSWHGRQNCVGGPKPYSVFAWCGSATSSGNDGANHRLPPGTCLMRAASTRGLQTDKIRRTRAPNRRQMLRPIPVPPQVLQAVPSERFPDPRHTGHLGLFGLT